MVTITGGNFVTALAVLNNNFEVELDFITNDLSVVLTEAKIKDSIHRLENGPTITFVTIIVDYTNEVSGHVYLAALKEADALFDYMNLT